MTALRALLLVFVSEAGWGPTTDHSAMYHVLERHAAQHDQSVQRSADQLVWRFSRARATRPWLNRLYPGCARPAGYPRKHFPREQCLELVALARRALAGELEDPCRGLARGWRSPGRALRRAMRRGWQPLSCGQHVVFVDAPEHPR